jgi:hypothetical protein
MCEKTAIIMASIIVKQKILDNQMGHGLIYSTK